MNKLLYLVAILSIGISVSAQTPTPEPVEKVATEEIRIVVSALDKSGEAVADLKTEDIVITEDGRLHQASSVRRPNASVLIAMDTGGTIGQRKNIGTTRSIASAIAAELRPGTRFGVMQFHDRAEVISDWTDDQRQVITAIDAKTAFGRRSSFTAGIEKAEEILAKAPTDNKHLILITDGLDSIENETLRSDAIRKLWQSGVVVHVISYTRMEFKAQRPFGGLLQKGDPNPRRMPEHVLEELVYAIPVRKILAREILRQIYQPRLLSIIIDKPFLRAQKNQSKDLAAAQVQLSVLAEHTGGEFYLPDALDEMTEQGRQVARNINSQHIVTYTPKRPLKDVEADEIRQIDVSSRREGLELRASRKLVVFGASQKQ